MKKLLLTAALIATALSTYAQIDPTRTVITVNGEEIKGNEYYHRMEYLPGVGKQTGNAISEFPPGFLTIEQLVTERLVMQLAKQKGVLPSDLEVTNELAERVKENPNLVADWKSTGRTDEDLRYQIRFDLAQFKLATFGITITDQEIDKYYAANPPLFTIPKQYKLSVILVNAEADKAAVDTDLKAGKAFADVARARSQDLTKNVGGAYGTIPITLFNETTRTALNNVKVGQNTGWITTTANDQPAFVKFRVDDVIAEKKEELTPALRRKIRRKRMLEMGSVKNNLEQQMIEMRKAAKIDIKQKEFADAYKRFIDAYLKQPRAGGTGK